MAKNQKRDVQALRWQTLGFVLFAVAAVAGMTLGYVLQRRAHQRLGEQVGALERKVSELNTVVQQRRVLRAQLSSPARLRQQIQEFGLGLTNVNPTQRLFVTLPAGKPQSLPANTQPGPELRRPISLAPTLAAATR